MVLAIMLPNISPLELMTRSAVGAYTVTIAQYSARNDAVPVVQQSKPVHLSQEDPQVSLDFDLPSQAP